MNTYNINDEEVQNSEEYKDFIEKNPKYGSLSIRAYAANQAIPISGLEIAVSSNIGDKKVIFFEGTTNSSGTIENILLPAPALNPSNLVAPIGTTYEILATYIPDNINAKYKVKVYDNIGVIQNISIVPNMKMGDL